MRVKRTKEFNKWLNKLKDVNSKNAIIIRIKRIEINDDLGDYKSVGEGVNEIRIHSGAGYRLYFIYENKTIILILLGGDKSEQKQDIILAKKINKLIKKGGQND